MPRDGLQQYAPPPGTQGVANYTVESARYNTFVADITADQNNPRPIVAGGTGAANAHDAMVALGGEIAGQHVDNYDMFPFVAGSFWSSGATAGPAGSGYYSGVCHVFDSDNMVLEAREYVVGVPGRRFSRQKQAGSWLAWQQAAGSVADLDAAYVNVAGDSMTGNLTVLNNANVVQQNGLTVGASAKNVAAVAGVSIMSNDPAVNQLSAALVMQTDPNPGNRRVSISCVEQGIAWRNVTLCEVGGNVGIGTASPIVPLQVRTGANNNFGVYDAGAGGVIIRNINDIGNAYQPMTFVGSDYSFAAGGVVMNGPVYSVNTATTGVYQFGNSGTKNLSYDGTNFVFAGGPLAVGPAISGMLTGDILTNRGGGGGCVFFGSASHFLFHDGSNFQMNGGALSVSGQLSAAGPGFFSASGGTTCLGSPGPSGGCAEFYSIGTATYLQSYNRTSSAYQPLNIGAASCVFNCNVQLGTLTATGNVVSTVGALCMNAVQSVYFRFDGASTTTYTYNNVTQTYWRATDNAFIHLAQAYKPGGGLWADSSDARIKNELGNYPRGLSEIAQLRPVYYTYKGNDTNEPPANNKDANGDVIDEPLTVPYPNSNHNAVAKAGTKYAGLIAQEVEAIFPEMVTKRSAYIDGEPVTDLRDLDTSPLIFALINAVKELKARIDVLEGTPQPK
jgi:hypothetical protein